MYSLEVRNANEAFAQLYDSISMYGTACENSTKLMRNVSILMRCPMENEISVPWRKWSKNYAIREWDWYVSGNRSVKDLKRYAPIWDTMHSGDDLVNSNYGFLWRENNQLQKVIAMLKAKPHTRQAWITMYDGKQIDSYAYDNPCTLAIGFFVENDMLHMQVIMRSNDLVLGFCNDQFCFSKLLAEVATATRYPIGTYYHYAANMHIYNDKLSMRDGSN